MSFASDSSPPFFVTAELRNLIVEAAERSGRSVDDFVADALTVASQQVLESEATTVLSLRDREIFQALLNSDAPPNAALSAAANASPPSHG
ncbi:MAG: hypothetical protein C0483_22290 [Pirellula sp.]|nr:hypothetical protein [Pirellula sp.]